MTAKGIYLERRLIESQAWFELTGTAMFIYGIFRLKCRLSKHGRKGKEQWSISNNGEIIFSYIEAKKKYGLTAPRFCRGIDDLLNKGFIDIAELGGGVKGYVTKYAISDRWKLYGTSEFRQAKRDRRTWGWPGFKKKPTNTSVSGSTYEVVRGRTKNSIATAYTNVRGQKVIKIYKLLRGKWIEQKTA